MDLIDEETFEKADLLEPTPVPKQESILVNMEEDMDKLISAMEHPVDAQKELAVKIKSFLDHQMETEFNEKGYLSESTRKWVDTYNSVLEKIQKAIHGDKSVNLHLHKITHGQIAARMRNAGMI